MQKSIRFLSVSVMVTMVVLGGSLAFAEQVLNFKDGTVIKGAIQNETLIV